MKIEIINGPNLNILEYRDKEFYGSLSLKEIKEKINLDFPSVMISYFQSNDETDLINEIQIAPNKFDGLIINPGGYSHNSIALRDTLESCSIPKIEVHLSNLYTRDQFRYLSLTASKCDGYIAGLKYYSYILAIYALIHLINSK